MRASSEKRLSVRPTGGWRAIFSALGSFFRKLASGLGWWRRGRDAATPAAGPAAQDFGDSAEDPLFAREMQEPLPAAPPAGRRSAFPEAELDAVEPPELLAAAAELGGDLREGDGRGSETQWLIAAEPPRAALRGTPRTVRIGSGADHGGTPAAPAVSGLLQRIILGAVAKGASHVLIRPLEKRLEVSYLIDGILIAEMHPSLELKDRLAQEIKAIASLDGALSRVPQSGSVKLVTDLWERHCTVRVQPTRLGEQIGLGFAERILH